MNLLPATQLQEVVPMMQDYEKFRAVLVDRIGPKRGRHSKMAQVSKILLIAAALFLIAGLVILVHDHMPALVNVGQEPAQTNKSNA